MARRRGDGPPGLIDRVRWGNVGRLAALLAAGLLIAVGPGSCGNDGAKRAAEPRGLLPDSSAAGDEYGAGGGAQPTPAGPRDGRHAVSDEEKKPGRGHPKRDHEAATPKKPSLVKERPASRSTHRYYSPPRRYSPPAHRYYSPRRYNSPPTHYSPPPEPPRGTPEFL